MRLVRLSKPPVDPLLQPFLNAAPGLETNEACWELFGKTIDPTLRSFGGKWGAGPAGTFSSGGKTNEQLDLEDIASEARLRLINKLYSLKEDRGESEINSIKAYVYIVAESLRAETLRKRNPNRSALSLKIRYLLDGGTNQRGFALWNFEDVEMVAGYAQWKGRKAETGPRYQKLLAHPEEAQAKALKGLPADAHLAEQAAAALDWVGAPLPFHGLVSILAVWTDTHDVVQSLQAPDSNDFTFDPPDLADTPDKHLIWKEYLQALWRTILETPLKWRTAFLLKADVTHEFVYHNIASFDKLARSLEIPSDELARLWPGIPLDDNTIASRLKLQRQQVINLRSIARRAFYDKLKHTVFEDSRDQAG